ncbi:MAG: hypothetical protein V2B19_08760 [Pseudomonadota bacterium]
MPKRVRLFKINIVHVPYKGAAQMLIEVAGSNPVSRSIFFGGIAKW